MSFDSSLFEELCQELAYRLQLAEVRGEHLKVHHPRWEGRTHAKIHVPTPTVGEAGNDHLVGTELDPHTGWGRLQEPALQLAESRTRRRSSRPATPPWPTRRRSGATRRSRTI